MVATEATGLVSVMPQACRMGSPVASWYRSESAFGTADPPHGIIRSAEVSRPSSSGSTPIQMVGTPAAIVTRSVSIISASAGGVIRGPGRTRSAPVATPAWARPHTFAWNIGTTGSTTSRSHTPIASAARTPTV